MLHQAEIYNDAPRRLELARLIEGASLYNCRENMKYYFKHNKNEQLSKNISSMTTYINEIKSCTDIQKMLLIEARAKQIYLQSFDIMINDSNFVFDKRTRRPPQNELNALISFGNTFLYRRIATEIYKTSLDIRIGFAHAANNRAESLNLDIAEIFKPIIVDRVIFTLIHKHVITKETHFTALETGGIYLSQVGKRIFISELEKKLQQRLTLGGRSYSYEQIIKNEIYKIYHCVLQNEKYKPFKYR